MNFSKIKITGLILLFLASLAFVSCQRKTALERQNPSWQTWLPSQNKKMKKMDKKMKKHQKRNRKGWW